MKSEKKTGADRTQRAIRDEWWSDERIKSFLDLETSSNEAIDFHILSKAYQGMIPEAFKRLLDFFIESGRNINETNRHGESLLSIVSKHRNSKEYVKLLKKAGAI